MCKSEREKSEYPAYTEVFDVGLINGVNIHGHRYIGVGLHEWHVGAPKPERSQNSKDRSKGVDPHFKVARLVVYEGIEGWYATDRVENKRVSHTRPVVSNAACEGAALAERESHDDKETENKNAQGSRGLAGCGRAKNRGNHQHDNNERKHDAPPGRQHSVSKSNNYGRCDEKTRRPRLFKAPSV